MSPKRSATAGLRRGLEYPPVEDYCETMKNVTVSLDEETWRNARVKAAEQGRSLSALVRDFLRDLGSTQSEFDRLHAQEIELRKKIKGFSGRNLLSRDELHERGR